MFDCCCGSNWSNSMKNKVEYKVEKTEKGIRIDVELKDPDKKQAFQDLMKACQEFCGTESPSCC